MASVCFSQKMHCFCKRFMPLGLSVPVIESSNLIHLFIFQNHLVIPSEPNITYFCVVLLY